MTLHPITVLRQLLLLLAATAAACGQAPPPEPLPEPGEVSPRRPQ